MVVFFTLKKYIIGRYVVKFASEIKLYNFDSMFNDIINNHGNFQDSPFLEI